MNAMNYLRIAPMLNDCPECGHDRVGTNESTNEFHGALIIDENLFTRSCRCGFSVTIDANESLTKKKIKEKIASSLREVSK